MTQILHTVKKAVTHDLRVLKKTAATLDQFLIKSLNSLPFTKKSCAKQGQIGILW